VTGPRLRLGIVGTGWIAGTHLGDLARLGRTELVGVVSRTTEAATATAETWGGQPYPDVDAMLDAARPDVVYVCVPPHRSVAIGERLVERGVPFLVEKPLAAADADGPARLAAAIERRGLVVAVGYHWRGLDLLAEIRTRLAERPARLVIARWLDGTPPPYWWGRIDQGGGQVIEQATHLLDLARHLVGKAEVVGASSTYDPTGSPPEVEVADATAATLRFASGAIGSFTTTRRIVAPIIELQIASDGLMTTLALEQTDGPTGDPRGWVARFEDADGTAERRAMRDPYVVQSETFLDAVEARDPTRVLCTYSDALRTDRLTRAIVAATGAPA
jgi:myo-inositol 2-dehydrogenase / D-chiro-inositol 1-dehydrogenase